ncbi:MAG: purine-nucleoside phosphorylase [Proteobacteria bacterium]|nr:purine-nucleoside phosphorylase [Pseudomonadota bacterium]
MHPEEVPVALAVERLVERFGEAPSTAIVLGSGLGAVVDRANVVGRAKFSDLSLPQSTIVGHRGEAIRGTLGNEEVIILSGRVHMYEGHSAQAMVRSVRAMHRWGVGQLVLTCSSGGLRKKQQAGDLRLISDHLNFQSDSPLFGPAWGTRFPDLSTAHDPKMQKALRQAAQEIGFKLKRGVYAAMNGPTYETPAEVRMLRSMGADLVGMSTVPEIVAAVAVGMRVVALTVISNLAAGLGEPVCHDDVTARAGESAKKLAELLEVAIGRF